MRKLKIYIAISLNGKIARADGQVDWLETIPNPEKSDYGYYDFYASIDTTIQGHKTYAQLLAWDIPFPYADKKNYVFTRNPNHQDTKEVSFVSEDHLAFTEKLKTGGGKDIWLIGGGQINTLLLNAGLVDELIVHIMPIILPDGLPLFGGIPRESQLRLLSSKSYAGGVVESRYEVIK
jgi:dihydrofolate reductase